MTRSELIARFPKASESFLAANSTLEAPQRARRRDLKSITLSEHTTPLAKDGTNRGGSIVHPKWSEAEDMVLTAYYKGYPKDKEFTFGPLMEVLKRSYAAIACRAGEIGVTFKNGERPKKAYVSEAKYSDAERSLMRSEKMKERHAKNGHHMIGKLVSEETRLKISIGNTGKKRSPDSILRAMQTRVANGTLINNNYHGSWKSAWRNIGGRRIFARSRWEANYARFLEWQKQKGLITEWEHEPETFWFLSIMRGSRSYLPDFRVTQTDGSIEYHEVKGWMDARSKTKIRRMAKYHPTVKLIIKGADWFKDNKTLRSIIPEWEHGKLS